MQRDLNNVIFLCSELQTNLKIDIQVHTQNLQAIFNKILSTAEHKWFQKQYKMQLCLACVLKISPKDFKSLLHHNQVIQFLSYI